MVQGSPLYGSRSYVSVSCTDKYLSKKRDSSSVPLLCYSAPGKGEGYCYRSIWCPLQIFSSCSLCCPAELGRKCGRRADVPRLAAPSSVYPHWELQAAAAHPLISQAGVGSKWYWGLQGFQQKDKEMKMLAHLNLWVPFRLHGRLSWRKFDYLKQCNSSALPECPCVSLVHFLCW